MVVMLIAALCALGNQAQSTATTSIPTIHDWTGHFTRGLKAEHRAPKPVLFAATKTSHFLEASEDAKDASGKSMWQLSQERIAGQGPNGGGRGWGNGWAKNARQQIGIDAEPGDVGYKDGPAEPGTREHWRERAALWNAASNYERTRLPHVSLGIHFRHPL